MSLEQTIKDTLLSESVDLDMRLQQLVRAGLMPSNTIPLLRKAITKIQGGYPLQGAERDVMANFLNSMMFIVLGDDAIFNKARVGAKSYATEAKEKQEYDYEGDMAMSQLKSIIANSQRMHDSMSEDTNLPEWVQSKITLAEDYISTAANYLQSEVNEGKRGLWDNIHAKRKRIKGGSGEKMRKPGSEGAPTAADFKASANEEVEQVDEVSKATLGRYINKAKDSVDLTAWRQGYKEAGAGNPSKQLEKKLSKRHKGIETAVKKLTKEDAEQIDELSKGKLQSYMDKAKTKPGEVVADVNDQGSMKKYGNRLNGRIRAGRKLLAKESRRTEALADIAAIAQMNESYKTTFDAALTQYGIKSPSELDEEKRKQFFNFVDQEYKKGDK